MANYPLTWRNVDAPNFSPAFEGMRTAASFFNNATRAGEGVVDLFTKAQANEADRAILNRALGYQNSGTFQNALASGAVVGNDAPNASLATLRGLDSRVGALLDRDVTRQGLDQRTYENDRTKQGNALMDSASPDLVQLRLLARNNDQAGIARLVQGSESLKALRPDQLNAVLTGADQSGSNYQARRGSDAAYSRGMYDLGRTVKADASSDEAQGIVMQILRNSPSAESAQREIEKLADKMSPETFMKVRSAANSAGYNVYGPVLGASAAGGGTSGGAARAGSAATGLMTGGAQIPDHIKTIGDYVDNKSNLLKSNPKGTAAGMYQMTADTWADFGPKALGAEWRTANIRDPAVQDKVSKALWDSIKNSDKAVIKGRWDALSLDEAEKLKGSEWSEVRDVLSQKESGSRASEILNQAANDLSLNVAANTAQQLTSERAGQNAAVGIFPELNKLQASRLTPNEAATNLVKEDGPLAGSNRGEVLDQINWIVRNSKNRINPAMAAEMIARNTESNNMMVTQGASRVANLFGRVFKNEIPVTSNTDAGVRIDNRAVQRTMDEYLKGNTSLQLQAQQSLVETNQAIAARREAYNKAQQDYLAVERAALNRPNMAAEVARYKQVRDVAEEALRRVTQSVVNSDTLTPRYDRPVAQTTGQ